MRTIDITTSQKVTISYEIASFQERLLAYILDLLIILGLYLVLSIFFVTIFEMSRMNFEFFFVIPLFLFYNLFSEIYYYGQTLGKKALGLRIIKMDGSNLSTSDFLIRWIFRSIDIYLSLGSISAMLISSSEYGQRLGGKLSHTVIIRVRPKVEFNLKDILSIKTSQNYQPVYREVTQLEESEVLLIKRTIDRFQKYPNSSHSEAIRELVNKVCEILQIPVPQKNKLNFLKTLLKDYVVLTR